MNISTNINSIYNNISAINNSASKVSNALEGTLQSDLTREIPKQITSQKAIEADAVSIKTQDDILGTLLDIKA